MYELVFQMRMKKMKRMRRMNSILQIHFSMMDPLQQLSHLVSTKMLSWEISCLVSYELKDFLISNMLFFHHLAT